jgi:hypothetical protein
MQALGVVWFKLEGAAFKLVKSSYPQKGLCAWNKVAISFSYFLKQMKW